MKTKQIYNSPRIETIEVETMESIMQYSGNKMGNVKMEESREIWEEIDWD